MTPFPWAPLAATVLFVALVVASLVARSRGRLPGDPESRSDPAMHPSLNTAPAGPDRGGLPESPAEQPPSKEPRRRRRTAPEMGLERIAEVHYCRTDQEANDYLALGPEWDLQDILPMRVETDDGGERDEVHFVVARWETDRDRARLRQRDRRFLVRKKPQG